MTHSKYQCTHGGHNKDTFHDRKRHKRGNRVYKAVVRRYNTDKIRKIYEDRPITTTTQLDFTEAKAWLQGLLTPERLAHSLGAYEKAAEMAEKFHLPRETQEQAAIAALLHDSAKLMNSRDLLSECNRFGIQLSEIDRATPNTLHPYVGAELVREKFGIDDPVILDAIRFHTTGREGMDIVEKLVYIADKIEGNTRNPLYIQKMTASLDFRSCETLDLTMLYLLDSTIGYLMEKHLVIHPQTIAARNDFITRLRAENRL
jgi:predicted HD superfamily hydrolase involved in NAD metabolism